MEITLSAMKEKMESMRQFNRENLIQIETQGKNSDI